MLSDPTFGIIERCKSARKKWRDDPSEQNLVGFLKAFGDLENTPSTTMEGLIAKLLYATSDPELQVLITDSSWGGPQVWIDSICKSIAAIRANRGTRSRVHSSSATASTGASKRKPSSN